jgi:hypothetical protein
MTALARPSSNCKRQRHSFFREDIKLGLGRKSSVERKIDGCEPQGTWRQDELICGKQPVVK